MDIAPDTLFIFAFMTVSAFFVLKSTRRTHVGKGGNALAPLPPIFVKKAHERCIFRLTTL